MWGTNQWWQMPYGYQYQMPTQGSSEDWAAKAAMWAQHRRVQEQTQHYYSQAALAQPTGYHGDLAQYQAQPYVEHGYDAQHANHQNTQEYPKEDQQAADAPPLPPEPEPTPPGLVPEEPLTITDNMEMVAMEAEAPEAVAPTPPVEVVVAPSVVPMPETQVNTFDTHPTLPPHPEYCPSPPSLANRETFDHNHGFDAPPPTQPYSVPQQIDYGHQSASAIDYNHQRQGPVVFDYSRQYDTGYQQQLPSERYFPPAVPPLEQMPQTDVTAAPSSVDYSGLSDVKKKGLPLWIREGLEKMEKQKRKQETATLNTSTSSLSSISGYKHSSTLSPAASPKGEESDEASDHDHSRKGRSEDRSSDEDEEDDKPTLRRGQHLFSRSQAKSKSLKAQDSSDEGDSKVDDGQREQNLVLNIRRLLTEILLTVTNDEITNIAQEAFDAAHKGSGRNLKLSGSASRLGVSAVLGLAGYGSDSGSESDAEVGNEDRKQRGRSDEDDGDDNREHYDNSRKSRSQKHRDDYASDSSEEHTKSHRSSKRRKKDKRRRSRSRSSDESDRSSSTPERKKSRRSKHSRRERSRSSSPKRRSKRSRKSRSRSRSPKKHKSSRKSRSRSRSSSESDSRSGSKHKRSKGDEKRKKRSSSRRSPASPGGKRDRRQKSRSRSRSSSPRRGKH